MRHGFEFTVDFCVRNDCPQNLFVTEKGRIDSGPVVRQTGDSLCAFTGSGLPLLIGSVDSQRAPGVNLSVPVGWMA